MKCDHLIGRTFNGEVYVLASEAMEAIAELKQMLDKAIAERDGNQVCIDALKAKLENVQASMYCDVVDANMEVRRLKRALYKACANWAYATIYYSDVHESDEYKWENMGTKCLKKAEEYK